MNGSLLIKLIVFFVITFGIMTANAMGKKKSITPTLCIRKLTKTKVSKPELKTIITRLSAENNRIERSKLLVAFLRSKKILPSEFLSQIFVDTSFEISLAESHQGSDGVKKMTTELSGRLEVTVNDGGVQFYVPYRRMTVDYYLGLNTGTYYTQLSHARISGEEYRPIYKSFINDELPDQAKLMSSQTRSRALSWNDSENQWLIDHIQRPSDSFVTLRYEYKQRETEWGSIEGRDYDNVTEFYVGLHQDMTPAYIGVVRSSSLASESDEGIRGRLLVKLK
jgi:hypothetical protein